MSDIERENTRLRGLLAWGTDPCIYCGLSRGDMYKCASGFPGCARSDDMMCSPDAEARFAEVERRTAEERARQVRLRDLLIARYPLDSTSLETSPAMTAAPRRGHAHERKNFAGRETVTPQYSYDEKCFELAQHFFPKQSFAFLEALAQEFQDCVEGREDRTPSLETLPGAT